MKKKKEKNDLHLEQQYFIKGKSFTIHRESQEWTPRPSDHTTETTPSLATFLSLFLFFCFPKSPSVWSSLSLKEKKIPKWRHKKRKINPPLSFLHVSSPFPILSFLIFVQPKPPHKLSSLFWITEISFPLLITFGSSLFASQRKAPFFHFFFGRKMASLLVSKIAPPF